MKEEVGFYKYLSTEAISRVRNSSLLTAERRSQAEEVVTSILTNLDESVSGRWSRLRWNPISKDRQHGVNVMNRDGTVERKIDVTSPNAETVRDTLVTDGLSGGVASEIVYGSVRRAILMIQAGVNTVQELERIKSRAKRIQNTEQGRQFSTKSGPTPDNTLYSSLAHMPPHRERRRV